MQLHDMQQRVPKGLRLQQAVMSPLSATTHLYRVHVNVHPVRQRNWPADVSDWCAAATQQCGARAGCVLRHCEHAATRCLHKLERLVRLRITQQLIVGRVDKVERRLVAQIPCAA